MKKIISILLIICTFAAVFAYTPRRIEPVETRSEAFGGPYLTDTTSVYGLFSNPAALGLMEAKTLWPPIAAMGLGGPLDKLMKIGSEFIKNKGPAQNNNASSPQDMTAIAGPLGEIIGKSGLSLGLRIGGPLTFGAVRKHFGWGFVNTISVDANIFSVSRSDVRGMGGVGFVVGYGYPIDLGAGGVLSVGLSARGMSQIETMYTDGIIDLVADSRWQNLPAYLSVGFGLDMGLQYEVFDIFSISAVCQDLYSPVWIQTYPKITEFGKNGSKFSYKQLDSRLGFGIKADIPLSRITLGIISEWGVYADYNNIWQFFKKNSLYRNPILELSFGTELVLFKILALRIGVNEMYPAMGLGLNLGKFKMDFSVYGKELGFEPGYNPQLNTGFSMLIKY